MGDLLQPVVRPVKILDDIEYQLVTARRSRGGIIAREIATGKTILTKTQFETRSGDFLISRRQIVHGACGTVPDALHGALVSGEYNTLLPTEQLDRAFLRHFPHDIYFQQTCFHSSIGVHVEKLIFKLDEWLRWRFNIPPVGEQRRIAAVLDIWDDAVATADRLAEIKARRFSGLTQLLISRAEGRKDELISFADTSGAKCDVDEGEFDESIELENVESRTGQLASRTSTDGLSGQRVRFEPGDTLFAKLRPYLRKSYYAEEPGMASTEMWVLRANRTRCLPRYLNYLIRSDLFQAQADRPTGSRMPRADWSWVQETPLPLPGLNEQGHIVSILEAAEADWHLSIDAVSALRRQKRGLMQKLLTGEWRVPATGGAFVPGSPVTDRLEAAE